MPFTVPARSLDCTDSTGTPNGAPLASILGRYLFVWAIYGILLENFTLQTRRCSSQPEGSAWCPGFSLEDNRPAQAPFYKPDLYVFSFSILALHTCLTPPLFASGLMYACVHRLGEKLSQTGTPPLSFFLPFPPLAFSPSILCLIQK